VYERILVPTDGSDEAQKATDYAVELASHFDATVHALYAVEPVSTSLPSEAMRRADLHEEYVEWGEKITGQVADQAEAQGLKAVTAVVDGNPHEAISEYAVDNDIDLIVMGTAGRAGLRERLLGSVTEKVIRISDVPVLTTRDRDDE